MPRGFLFFVKMRTYSNIFIHIPGFTKSDLEFISNSTTHEEVTLLAATFGKDFRLLGIEPSKNFIGDTVICYHISKNEVSVYNYGFAFKTLEIVKNRFYYRLSNILNWIYGNILQPICFIPTYTELDAMPKGWRKCFGISICKEIKASLKRHNCLEEYRITQIKEKFGGLR